MTTEEKLWWRFKDVEEKVRLLSSIVQNPLEGHKVPTDELAQWSNNASKVKTDLAQLVIDTQLFLGETNVKDI